MKLNPQYHRALESGLATLHVTRLDPKKVHKVGPDWGLNRGGASAGRPQAVYKVALRLIKVGLLTATSNNPHNTYFKIPN
jgi:hypothetical protein